MPSRTEIQRRARLTDAEMDRVIERASQLQEQELGVDAGRSVEEIKEVGKELDIDPRFVDRAVEDLQRERDEAARARAGKKKLVAIALAALLGIGALAGVTGFAASGSVRKAEETTQLAEVNLDTVVKRQAALIPALVALVGGQVDDLKALQDRVDAAPDAPSRLAAAQALSMAMASKLGQLPPSPDPASAQQRLSLHHELVGAQNRITVEQRRYESARAAWRAAAESPSGRIAVALGFARGPR